MEKQGNIKTGVDGSFIITIFLPWIFHTSLRATEAQKVLLKTRRI